MLPTKLDDELIVTVDTRTDDLIEVLPVTVSDGDKVMYDVENELAVIVMVESVTECIDDRTEDDELLLTSVSTTVLSDDDTSKEDTDDDWTAELEPLMRLEVTVEITEDDSTGVNMVDGIEDDHTELEVLSDSTLDVYEESVKDDE